MEQTNDMLVGLIATNIIGFAACGFLGYFIGRIVERNQPEPDEIDRLNLPKCAVGCEVNECEIWCDAKERFMRNPPNE